MSAEIIPFPQAHRGPSLADVLEETEARICHVIPRSLRHLFLRRLRRAGKEIEHYFRAESGQIPAEWLPRVHAVEIVRFTPLYNALDRADAIQLVLDLAFVKVVNPRSRRVLHTWGRIHAHIARELNISQTRSRQRSSGGLS
ncbi:MAG: hypothetical protein WB679_06680 [Terracidiphilus sp.]